MNIQVIIDQIHYHNFLWVVMLPLILMGVDVLTGVVYAWRDRCFDSSKMRSGLAKKIGEIAALFFGVIVMYALDLPQIFLKCVSLYLVFMEGMSILENLDKLRVPVPGFVRKVINNIDKQLKSEELPKKEGD